MGIVVSGSRKGIGGDWYRADQRPPYGAGGLEEDQVRRSSIYSYASYIDQLGRHMPGLNPTFDQMGKTQYRMQECGPRRFPDDGDIP